MKPFRWTKQNIVIRDALNNGYTKDRILKLVQENHKDERPSELAMTLSHWEMAIERVIQQLKDSKL